VRPWAEYHPRRKLAGVARTARRGRSRRGRKVAVSRLLVSSAAICSLAVIMVGINPVARAQPTTACGPDQATAVDVALAHVPHDSTTRSPWSHQPVASNYDPCADLSAVLVTIDLATPSSPIQALLFHRGSFLGTATSESHPYTTLDSAASTKDTVVLEFISGRSCSACNDGTRNDVRYHWDGARAVMVNPLPPHSPSP
jgi:LppP/LprE lipoprotein